MLEKTVNGQVYIYERTPYYDKTLKNTKYHYKYVGKEVNGEARKIRSVLPKRSLICGPFIPIMKIVRDMGIMDILKLYLTEQEARHVLALAISKVVRPLPQASINTWYDGTYLSVLMPASLTSQRNSDLMEKIGISDLYRKFSHDMVERLHPGDSLLYDITSIPSYSLQDIFEYGHAKDHLDLEQVNLSMVMERNRRVPLYFEMYSGSIPDVVTLRRTMDQVKPMIPGIEIILDRGFFSLDNLKLLGDMRYIIAASMVRKEVKSVFSKASRTVDRSDNVILHEDNPIFCQRVEFSMDDIRLKGFFYHDVRSEGEERSDFHRKITERRKEIEKLQARKGVRRTIEGIAGSYMHYISYDILDGRITTAARDNAISAAENRMGRFLLVYMGDYSGSECLSLYRQRDAIEKAFRSLKTDLDIFPLRNHKESTIRGILFVFFISLIIRSALLRGMESSGLLKKYSLERMLLEALEGISWW